jgi:hypothetical protein
MPLIGGFAAQVFQRREQGEMPRRVGQIAGLRQIAHHRVFMVGRTAVGGEGQLLHALGQSSFAFQRHQFVEREPVILQAARQSLFDFAVSGIEPI